MATTKTQTALRNVNFNLSENTFTRTGYNFLGWSTIQTDTTPKYTDKELCNFDSDKYLYAIWKKTADYTNFVFDGTVSGYTSTLFGETNVEGAAISAISSSTYSSTENGVVSDIVYTTADQVIKNNTLYSSISTSTEATIQKSQIANNLTKKHVRMIATRSGTIKNCIGGCRITQIDCLDTKPHRINKIELQPYIFQYHKHASKVENYANYWDSTSYVMNYTCTSSGCQGTYVCGNGKRFKLKIIMSNNSEFVVYQDSSISTITNMKWKSCNDTYLQTLTFDFKAQIDSYPSNVYVKTIKFHEDTGETESFPSTGYNACICGFKCYE